MTERRKLDEGSLGALGLPRALREEFLELDALGLDRPAPTEELVQATLERCEEALERLQPAKRRRVQEKEFEFGRAFSWQTHELSTLTQSLGPLNACVLDKAIPYARANPDEHAVLLIEDHSLINPELWKSNPSLVLLKHVYRATEDILERSSSKPIDRLIILKEDPEFYDEEDLDVMRAAIQAPTTRCTYLVAAKHAGPLKGRSCTVVAKEVLFEMEEGDDPYGIVMRTPGGLRDPTRAIEVCRNAEALKKKALRMYEDDRLNRELEKALESNARLLDVLKDISG